MPKSMRRVITLLRQVPASISKTLVLTGTYDELCEGPRTPSLRVSSLQESSSHESATGI